MGSSSAVHDHKVSWLHVQLDIAWEVVPTFPFLQHDDAATEMKEQGLRPSFPLLFPKPGFLCMSPCPSGIIAQQIACGESEANAALQEERLAVSMQEGADLPLDHLRLDAPNVPSLWKEQYQVNILQEYLHSMRSLCEIMTCVQSGAIHSIPLRKHWHTKHMQLCNS